MKTISDIIERIDGRGYKRYKMLLGASETVDGVRVRVVRVQGDPYAPPSVVRLEAKHGFPEWSRRYRVALADWVYRRLYGLLKRYSRRRGEGRSGFLGVPRPGPVMLRRSGVEVLGDRVVARVWVGLPSRRRRVLGGVARELLLEVLPRVLRVALDWRRDIEGLRRHVVAWRLQEYLRSRLSSMGLVSFVGDGSILPRRCGGCDEPLPDAVPFESPSSLRVEVEVPWLDDTVTGMGVRKGLTVVMGSAFHGKSTLLEAIAAGVWNHIPGDGRERVVTIREAMYVRAEDGRFVTCVDVYPFIHDLPGARDTLCFSTSDASGATSTAASIQEAVEAGAELILLDEDSVATNILYSDERVEGLIKWSTITPIAVLARGIIGENLSLIIVSSGNLQLLEAADTIILMEGYRARDITAEAKKLVSLYKYSSREGKEAEYRKPSPRTVKHVPLLAKPRIKGKILYDKRLPAPVIINDIHLVEESQYNTIISILHRIKGFENKTFREIAEDIERKIVDGFHRLIDGEPPPSLGEIRGLDLIYVLNRLPGLLVSVVERNSS